MIIRDATLEDMPRLLQMEQNLIDSERPFDLQLREEDVSYYNIPQLISSSDSSMVVAESNDEIVGSGYAQIRQSKSFHVHQRYCYLGFIYLEPDYRGQGISRRIIEALKEWGVKQGIRNIQLNVYAENESAIRAYEKVGFKKVSVSMELLA